MWMTALLPLLFLSAELDRAEELIRDGLQLRREDRDLEALAKFEEACALSPTPRARAQIGLAQQALERWADAETNLAAALEAADDPWIGRHRSVLEESLAEIRERLRELKAAEPARETTSIEVAKEPEPAPPAEAPQTAASPPEPAVAGAVDRSKDSGLELGTLKWIAAGGAAAGLALGTASLFARNSYARSYNRHMCPPGTEDAQCRRDLDGANSAQAVMTAGLIAAGVLGAGAGALFVLHTEDDSARAQISAGENSLSIFVQGEF